MLNDNSLRKINILETFSKGQKDIEHLCEDLYVTNDAFVAVIDGASSSVDFKIHDKTPGRFAAEIVKSTLLQSPADLYIDQLIEQINLNLQSVYKELDYFEAFKNNPAKTPTAVMSVYSNYYNEIWLIGDCQCMVDGEHFQHEKIIDTITTDARALFLESEINKGKTIDELMQKDTGRTFIQPLLNTQSYFQNGDPTNPYSYEVINGFPMHLSQIQKINLSDESHDIILASDGYPVLKPTLEETEEELARLLEEDPLCFRDNKSTKGLISGNQSFDDRTFIKFTV